MQAVAKQPVVVAVWWPALLRNVKVRVRPRWQQVG